MGHIFWLWVVHNLPPHSVRVTCGQVLLPAPPLHIRMHDEHFELLTRSEACRSVIQEQLLHLPVIQEILFIFIPLLLLLLLLLLLTSDPELIRVPPPAGGGQSKASEQRGVSCSCSLHLRGASVSCVWRKI